MRACLLTCVLACLLIYLLIYSSIATYLPGCHKAEVIFMVEHLRGDSEKDVDDEAIFIRNMANGWKIDDGHVRVGVLAYDKEVKEVNNRLSGPTHSHTHKPT